jgi:hypothetical protein
MLLSKKQQDSYRMSLMQQQVVVTYTISQTEIPASLDIWVKKKHNLRKLCVHTQKIRFSLYFRKRNKLKCWSINL